MCHVRPGTEAKCKTLCCGTIQAKLQLDVASVAKPKGLVVLWSSVVCERQPAPQLWCKLWCEHKAGARIMSFSFIDARRDILKTSCFCASGMWCTSSKAMGCCYLLCSLRTLRCSGAVAPAVAPHNIPKGYLRRRAHTKCGFVQTQAHEVESEMHFGFSC